MESSSAPNSFPLSGWAISQENYRGNPRYFIVQSKAVFKQIRLEGGLRLFTEISNEIVCHSLGLKLSVPLVPTFLGILPSKGIGLFSFILGELPFNPADAETRSRISNIEKLKDLFVFDQFIYNDDRRPDHIMIGSEPTSPQTRVMYAFDHGHTLNGYNGQKWTLDNLSESEARNVAQILFDSGISNYSDLQPMISKVSRLTDDQIDRAVEDSLETIRGFSIQAEELTKVLTNAEVVKKLIKLRRNLIEETLRNWCVSTAKPIG